MCVVLCSQTRGGGGREATKVRRPENLDGFMGPACDVSLSHTGYITLEWTGAAVETLLHEVHAKQTPARKISRNFFRLYLDRNWDCMVNKVDFSSQASMNFASKQSG